MGVLLRHESPKGRLKPIVYALALAVGYALVLLRKPGAVTHSAFWAEDGAVFYLEQKTIGFEPLHPYQSQVWLLQRIAAWVTNWLDGPAGSAAGYYVLSCTIVVVSMSVLLTTRAEVIFGALPFRLVVFGLLLLLPGVWEVHGNLANLHVWATVSVMLCLSLGAPSTRWGRAVELAWIAITALSGFSAVILLPMAIWGAARFRTRYTSVRAGITAVGSLVAVFVWVTGDRQIAPSDDAVGRLWVAAVSVVDRVGGTLVRGEQPPDGALWPWTAAFLLAVVAVLGIADWRGPSPIWMACGGMWLFLGAISQPAAGVRSLEVPYMHGRYFTLLLAASVLVMGRALASDSTATALRTLASAGLLLVCIGIAFDYLLPGYRSMTADEISQYEACIETGNPQCPVPVRPDGWIRPNLVPAGAPPSPR